MRCGWLRTRPVIGGEGSRPGLADVADDDFAPVGMPVTVAVGIAVAEVCSGVDRAEERQGSKAEEEWRHR